MIVNIYIFLSGVKKCKGILENSKVNVHYIDHSVLKSAKCKCDLGEKIYFWK